MEYSFREKRGPGELIDIQGLSSPSTGAVSASQLMWTKLRKCGRSLPGLYEELRQSLNAENEYAADEVYTGDRLVRVCRGINKEAKTLLVLPV